MFKLGWASTVRDAFIALFTGFILTYFALTIIGAAFRGKGQELVPPTRVPNLEEYPNITREHAPPSDSCWWIARTAVNAHDECGHSDG